MEPVYIVQPTQPHSHTTILLHGKESTAAEFAPEFFESQASDGRTFPEIFPSIKWVFPQAKLRPSLRFETEDCSMWFDMWSVENPSERPELQKAGLEESIAQILSVVREEAKTVGLEKIVLGGISQGCATAIKALLSSDLKLAGFVGVASWLPADEKVGDEGMLKTPVFLAHSQDDDVVLVRNGENVRDALLGRGMTVTWKGYEDGGHWFHEPEGVDDIVEFLQKCFQLP